MKALDWLDTEGLRPRIVNKNGDNEVSLKGKFYPGGYVELKASAKSNNLDTAVRELIDMVSVYPIGDSKDTAFKRKVPTDLIFNHDTQDIKPYKAPILDR